MHYLGFQRKRGWNLKRHSWVPVQVGGLSLIVQHERVMECRMTSVATARLNVRSAPGKHSNMLALPRLHRLHPRHLSSIVRYPAIHDFASSLAQSQPSFALSSEKVHILSNPADFYTRLTVSHQRWSAPFIFITIPLRT